MYHDNNGDVVFICGSLNKNVHSFLLAARSTVFDKMLQSLFQVGLPPLMLWFLIEESRRKDNVSKSS